MTDRHYHDLADDPALGALSDLYRQAPAPEPPPALDARILSMAREETKVRHLPLRRLRRWQVPLSLAALLVVAVTLVPLLRQELPDTRSPASLSTDGLMEAPSGPQLAPAAKSSDAVPASPPPVEAQPSTPPPNPRRHIVPGSSAAGRDALRREQPPSPPVPTATQSAPMLDRQVGDTVSTERTESREVLQIAPSSTGLAAPEPQAASAMAEEAPVVVTEEVGSTLESAPAALSDDDFALDAPTSVEQAPARTAVFSDPERWLTWIRLLYRQGRTADARAEVAAFRRQFPDYPLDSLEPVDEP